MKKRLKVLIVDDSATVRRVFTDALSSEPDIEVMGAAPDPYVARDLILRLKPDVLTLDIEMPRLDGLSFLRKLMKHHPLPVIMISSLAKGSARVCMEALEAGAVEVLAKPSGQFSVGELGLTLANKIRAAAQANLKVGARSSTRPASTVNQAKAVGTGPLRPVIAIGASTGGTEAICSVLEKMPANCPPIVIAQHIPAGFSKAFADRMNRVCAMKVEEAADGVNLQPGLALVAPGDFHMLVRGGGALRAEVKKGPLVCYQRPAVDVLFESVAQVLGKQAIGVILTGMGADGAQGLLRMRRSGARTIGQDKATSVVYGMPKEAFHVGAVEQVAPLHMIAGLIMNMVEAGVPAPAR
ncbi:MAG: chemotaxis response regulator protein-glutamate methylesterase [Acidimicrobiia bacterium]|nr:chemotaxis response regulator protein-glutamate methylesterase [Acidimicrobiia bacterium]